MRSASLEEKKKKKRLVGLPIYHAQCDTTKRFRLSAHYLHERVPCLCYHQDQIHGSARHYFFEPITQWVGGRDTIASGGDVVKSRDLVKNVQPCCCNDEWMHHKTLGKSRVHKVVCVAIEHAERRLEERPKSASCFV